MAPASPTWYGRLRQPPSTVHRLLAVLKAGDTSARTRRASGYGLTLKMLDLSFKALGRSEIRLHAYPQMREHVLATAHRAFIAIPSSGEVTICGGRVPTRWRCTPPTAARCRRTARSTSRRGRPRGGSVA
ncbi:MAG: hypothetical protein R2712_01715 [Vicinamibacterales bacterium]